MSSSASAPAGSPFGQLLRHWRHLRGTSQLELALESGVSTRHLSYLETGRSSPSRAMVLRLAESLDVPLRERNSLLGAAGFAALYRETDLEAPQMGPLRRMLDFILERHEPFPALLLDRCWRVLRPNAAARRLFGSMGSGPPWDETPLNLMRVTLHPNGLQPFLVNFDEVAAVLLTGLHRAMVQAGNPPELTSLYEELTALPGVSVDDAALDRARESGLVLPLHIRQGDFELRLFSAVTVVASPQDITLEELKIESIMPADEKSEELMHALARSGT